MSDILKIRDKDGNYINLNDSDRTYMYQVI